MAMIRNSVVIRRSPEDVFDYISDLRNELKWNPKCEVAEKITDGSIGVGTKFRAKWKVSPMVEVEILEYDRPHNWIAHNGGSLEVTLNIRLEPVAEGTRLYADFNAQSHGFLRLIFPIISRKLRAEEKANMGLLRDALESDATPVSSIAT